MSYAPARLLELQSYMQLQTGLPVNALGIVGDSSHDGGYHCGWDRRRIRNGSLDDYSWEESSRDWDHKTNAARAFDCGSFDRLQEMSKWIVGQCQAGAPDTLDIRSIIYSPDGVTVLRWDRLNRHSGGDSSHESHTHFSFFADAENRDKMSVFQRFFGGAMTTPQGAHNQAYVVQNGMLFLETPDVLIPAEGSFPAASWPNMLGLAIKALVEGTDAVLPPFVHIPARTWKNGTAAQLDRMEAKLDQLLAMPPGTMNPESIRDIVRQELDKTGLREI